MEKIVLHKAGSSIIMRGHFIFMAISATNEQGSHSWVK